MSNLLSLYVKSSGADIFRDGTETVQPLRTRYFLQAYKAREVGWKIMEEFLDIITYFPGECIAIVIGVIGSIIAIAAIKKDREQKKE